ncbi:hypothetical protein HY772_04575 [Candidatus Woesearchaeota archaeon]|nr:hypothetical protein [Candidatus Woesearchaeota archaeon]
MKGYAEGVVAVRAEAVSSEHTAINQKSLNTDNWVCVLCDQIFKDLKQTKDHLSLIHQFNQIEQTGFDLCALVTRSHPKTSPL